MFKQKLNWFQSLLLIMRNQAGAINPETGLEDPDYVPEKDDKPDDKGNYPKAFVEKLLREKNNFKTKANELEEQLKVAQKGKEKPDDKADDQHKALLKLKDEENKALKEKLDKHTKEMTEAKKLGTLKQEFDKNGGNAKQWELITRLADVSKIMIDEESGVVYGAEAEIKRIKELAPTFFGKQAKGTADGDMNTNNNHETDQGTEQEKATKALATMRLKKDKDGKNPLVDFYASHNMLRK